ncbi:MAG: Gfo/Idh/MocA family oxidoreductase [Flammeovirgaceae bacterium]|nr:Gfo/Idh/MocA family oxidoreductase [Flammeovirgaceae bacterium]
MGRKLKMGMIGGGPGAFIGSVHRMAANLDGEIELVCGVFSSDPKKSLQTGKSLHLDHERIYFDFESMIKKESILPVSRRMDFVSIVTPNHLHYKPAALALQYGFHVIMDKPMTFDLEEARKLKEIADESNKLFALTFTYTGYPMVKEARQLVQSKRLGKIRKVYVEYIQGWLSDPLEKGKHKQAEWRTDPKRAGEGGCVGDIGIHAANLAEYVSGRKIQEVCASLNSVVAGRKLDDDCTIMLKLENGITGSLICTQVAAGEENNLSIRVYGEKGGLEWRQEEPNTLIVKWEGKPKEELRVGWTYNSGVTLKNTRTPSGHPEGYLEAFANIYKNFSMAIQNQNRKKNIAYDFPDVNEGLRGMAFIRAAVKSSQAHQKWTAIKV